MPKDTLHLYTALRASLLKEKQRIEQRLVAINKALGDTTANVPVPVSSKAPAPGRLGKRLRNRMSLPSAIVKVTSARPKTKAEILEGVQALGYRFATKNPMNSINVVLYGRNPKFKNANGLFSPAK